MGKKGAMPNYATINDYISNQKPEVQPLLQEMKELVQMASPNAKEVKDYKVPRFNLVPESKVSIQLMFSANAKGISFYPFEAAVSEFTEQLKEYKTGKGSVNFLANKPLPRRLIIEMVRFREGELKKH